MTAPAIPPIEPASRRRELLVLLLLTFATCALGWLFKAHCSFDGYWSGAEQYTTGCYSDAMPFWGGRAVDAGRLPYFQSRMEYPVLIGALIYLEGLLTRLVFGASAGAPDFLAVVTIVNGLFAMAVTRVLWGMGLSVMRLRAWALAPPLVLYVGHNWDMLAVLLAVMALAAAQRARFPAASALAGLAAAAKFFPLLLLPLFALKPLADRRVAAVATMAAAALGAWALVNAPVAALAWTNWAEFYVFSGTRSGTAASFWMLAQQFGWLTIDVAGVNRWSGVLFLAGAIGIVAIGWRAHRDRLWMLAAPVVAWFLLTSKVYSPQFDLWLYPLLLIGAPRLKPVAAFVIGDIIAYFAEFWLFAGTEGAWPADGQRAVLVAAAIRAAAMLWLIADSLRLPPPAWSHAPVD
jgi:uncharacterized membrane protein